MVNRLEIVDKPDAHDEIDTNIRADSIAAAEKAPQEFMLRRQSIEEMIFQGTSSSEIQKRLGIDSSTFFKDLRAIGTPIREGLSDPNSSCALAYTSYIAKRNWLIEEIKHAKNPYVTIKAVEVLDVLDRNWHDFLFKSGILRTAPVAEMKDITVRFITSDADLAQLAAQTRSAQENAIDAEFHQSEAATCEGDANR